MNKKEKDLLKIGMTHLSESLASFYEMKSPEGLALAFFADAAVCYGQALMNGKKEPRLSEEAEL